MKNLIDEFNKKNSEIINKMGDDTELKRLSQEFFID